MHIIRHVIPEHYGSIMRTQPHNPFLHRSHNREDPGNPPTTITPDWTQREGVYYRDASYYTRLHSEAIDIICT